MANNSGYVTAVEKLAGIEVPERAQFLRTLMAELTRLSGHLVWLGTHALDIGAMTVCMYTLRERELITLAANIAMARPVGTHSHYRSAKHIGISKEEIMEVIMHVGHYTGWPTMSLAVEQYTQVLKEDAEKEKQKK